MCLDVNTTTIVKDSDFKHLYGIKIFRLYGHTFGNHRTISKRKLRNNLQSEFTVRRYKQNIWYAATKEKRGNGLMCNNEYEKGFHIYKFGSINYNNRYRSNYITYRLVEFKNSILMDEKCILANKMRIIEKGSPEEKKLLKKFNLPKP